MFEVLALLWFGLVSFSLLSVISCLSGVRKDLKQINDNLSIFINYFVKK